MTFDHAVLVLNPVLSVASYVTQGKFRNFSEPVPSSVK